MLRICLTTNGQFVLSRKDFKLQLTKVCSLRMGCAPNSKTVRQSLCIQAVEKIVHVQDKKKKPASKYELMLETPTLRSSPRQFEFTTDCLFRDEEASAMFEKNKGPKFLRKIYEVRTIKMRDSVIPRTLDREDE